MTLTTEDISTEFAIEIQQPQRPGQIKAAELPSAHVHFVRKRTRQEAVETAALLRVGLGELRVTRVVTR